MSKQANEVGKILTIIFDDYASEVDISRITNVKLHHGIIVDFWIQDINCVIEVHGVQHEKVQSFGMNKVDALSQFNKQMNRDAKLKQICEDFNINYVEIWYNEETTMANIFKKLSPFMGE